MEDNTKANSFFQSKEQLRSTDWTPPGDRGMALLPHLNDDGFLVYSVFRIGDNRFCQFIPKSNTNANKDASILRSSDNVERNCFPGGHAQVASVLVHSEEMFDDNMGSPLTCTVYETTSNSQASETKQMSAKPDALPEISISSPKMVLDQRRAPKFGITCEIF